MKDLVASFGVVRFARLSIYDRVGGSTVNDILYGRTHGDPLTLRAFAEGRLA